MLCAVTFQLDPDGIAVVPQPLDFKLCKLIVDRVFVSPGTCELERSATETCQDPGKSI
jgi:hypothetical protein